MRMSLTLTASLTITFIAISSAAATSPKPVRMPNIVFFLADDLGYGDVGCFGQKKIRTPNIDRLAAEGMRFTSHYSGNNVCAPSRCTLMSGKHPGHAFIRDNKKSRGDEGQFPVPPNELTLPLTLKKLGYTLGGFGKWGLGPVGSTGDPLKQGFDRFYGYNCQAVAHNYYPTHLWDNDKHVDIGNPAFSAYQKLAAGANPNEPESYARYIGKAYAPRLISEEAIRFVRDNKDRPFFLYYPTTVPHLALQAPGYAMKEYEGAFPETPYDGSRGYLPNLTPRATYAAMVSDMDRWVGRIVCQIRDLGLDDNTIYVFSSDNGPLYDRLGGTDTEFFDSAAGLRGRKGSFYEGGFRVPCVVRWKGHVPAGTTSDRVTGFEDWLSTLLQLIGRKAQTPAGIDGISFAPTILGHSQTERPFLYRESPGYGGQQCVRVGKWKAIRTNLHPRGGVNAPKTFTPGAVELYDLSTDRNETTNVADQHPDRVRELSELMKREHVPSKQFPMRGLDENPAPPEE